MTSLTLEVASVMALAATVRAAFGFGEALVAVPLLALVMPVQAAVPVAALASIAVAGAVLSQDWRHVHFRSAGWLVASTLVGIPFGLLLLKTVPETAAKAALGVLILAFSAQALWRRQTAKLADDRFAWLFGFTAGIFGGAYGLNGPPLAVYGSLRGWTPERFRATLQGYFLPASVAGMFGFWLAGLWTPEVTRLFLVSLPAILAGTVVGRWLGGRLRVGHFLRLVHLGLLAIGLCLLLQVVHS